MAEPQAHINYSFEDIQRYLNGGMSATEMHDIEKAALQDAFLADAIEGFNEADLTTAKQHLNEINASLIKEKKQSKVVAFNKKTQWLNVAAAIIIIVGIGLVVSFFLNSSNKQTQMAQLKNNSEKNAKAEEPKFEKLNASPAFTDTVKFAAKDELIKEKDKQPKSNTVTDKSFIAQDKEDAATVSTVPNASTQQNENNLRSFSAMSKTVNNRDTVQNFLQAATAEMQALPTTFSGKVVDENNNPVAGALIQSADKKVAVISDVNGDFNLLKNDSVVNVTASTVGYDSKTEKMQSNNKTIIVLRGTNNNMNDVVTTTALGVQRKEKSLGYSSTKDSAIPIGGWQNFNSYVLTQLNKDSTADIVSNERDRIELEFFIDKQGNPYNIKATKGADENRNAKAVDILKNGPKWTSASKNKKAKVSIAVP